MFLKNVLLIHKNILLKLLAWQFNRIIHWKYFLTDVNNVISSQQNYYAMVIQQNMKRTLLNWKKFLIANNRRKYTWLLALYPECSVE